MKKKDLVLDFTSLLDVIMIILFVVVSSMGQTALNAQAESEKEVSDLQEEVNQLSTENNDLRNENALLSEKAGESNVSDGDVLEALLKRTAKITLDCNTYVDEEKSDSNKVDITVYTGVGSDDQENDGTISFSHNFNLSTEEREKKNADMQRDMLVKLKDVIEPLDVELVIISIQYKYDDLNFSQADLDNILAAISNLERELEITCFVNNIKR